MWWFAAALWALTIWVIVYQPVYRVGNWWLDRQAARREATKTVAGTSHVHGLWCHPSADGCPDRPGM